MATTSSLSYWLNYGKPGKRVLVSFDDVDGDGNDVQKFIWVDLDNQVAEEWDFEKPYDETRNIG